MKNLTGILLISFVTLFAYPTQAQTVGIKGGLNLATMLAKMDQQTYSNDFTMNPGFHVGLTVDVPINEFLSFEPGILLSTKGLKFEPEEMGGTVIAKEILYYLDIPLTLKASHNLSDNLKIFAAAGPYVGIGLSGKYTMTTEAEGNVEKEEIDVIWGSDPETDHFKRLDTGLTFSGGVEIRSILLGVSYDLGLNNIESNQETQLAKNRVLRFSVGYRF